MACFVFVVFKYFNDRAQLGITSLSVLARNRSCEPENQFLIHTALCGPKCPCGMARLIVLSKFLGVIHAPRERSDTYGPIFVCLSRSSCGLGNPHYQGSLLHNNMSRDRTV
jgi:hypothetical protein